jgi:hypothetical protein
MISSAEAQPLRHIEEAGLIDTQQRQLTTQSVV